MKFRALVGLLLLLAAPAVFAQYTTVSSTGVTDSSGITYISGSYNVTLYNTTGQPAYFQGTPLPDSLQKYSGALGTDGSFSITLPSNDYISTGLNGPVSTTQWTFTVCAAYNNSCYSKTISITGATQDVTSTINGAAVALTFSLPSGVPPGPSGYSIGAAGSQKGQWAQAAGQKVAPNQNAVYVSPNCGTQTNCYPIKATGAFDCGQSWTASSHNITLSANATRQFTQADVGTSAWGYAMQCGAWSASQPSNSIPLTTIASVTDGTHAVLTGTISSGCTAGAEGGCTFVWGDTDETTAMNTWFAAVTAQGTCGTGILPSGIIFVSGVISNASPCTSANYAATTQFNFSIIGQGEGQSIIVPMPGFNANSQVCAIFCNTATAGNQGVRFANFSINAFGGTLTNVSATSGLVLKANSLLENVAVENWGIAQFSPQFTALTSNGIDGSPAVLYYPFVINSGGTASCSFTNYTIAHFPYCMGNAGFNSLSINNSWTDHGNFGMCSAGTACVAVTAGGFWYSSHDFIQRPRSGQTAVSIPSTSTGYLSDMRFELMSTAANGISCAGTCYLRGIVMPSGATASLNDSGTIYDNGGNSIAGSSTITGAYYGSASQAAVTSAATNFGTALTAQNVNTIAPVGPVTFNLNVVQSTLGVGCGAGTNTVTPTLAWTGPGGTAETLALTALSISANGTLDSNQNDSATISAKAGTTISYTTASALASTGCSTTPQYTVYAKATQ